MTRNKKQSTMILLYLFLIIVGIILIYPFLWLIGASFNETYTLRADPNIWPKNPSLSGYLNGWKGSGAVGFSTFFINTYRYVFFKVIFTVFSVIITAYGFSRFEFPGKKIWFSILIGTLLFPHVVTLVPNYIIFTKLHWVNTYLPMLVPALFAGDTYFVYLLYQFLRAIPRDMDEAAMIDGCGPIRRLIQILLPILQPSIVTIILFQFIWTGNDFLNPMIFISSETKFPVSVGLKMFIDSTGSLISWASIFAMSTLAILPPLIVFIFAQRTFIEGISTSGLKG